MGVGGQRHVLVALTRGKTQYPLYKRVDKPQGPVWTGAENLAHPPGFEPRTTPLYFSICRTYVEKIQVSLKPDTNNWYSIRRHHIYDSKGKGKAIPLQGWTGPEVSRRMRLPDFKTIGT
jgi:hypothetical protein